MNDKHMKLSASAQERILKCTGSVWMAQRYPSLPSKYSKEGTAAHKINDQILTDVILRDANMLAAANTHLAKAWDPEMRQCCKDFCAQVYDLIMQTGATKVGIEKDFVLNESLGIGGRADVAFLCESAGGSKVLVIIDYKHGQGVPVEVVGNPQLACYAVSGDATEGWGPVDRAVVYIYQPRAAHPDGPLRALRLNRSELNDWRHQFLEAARRVKEAEATDVWEFVPGEHCRWCTGRAVCEVRIKSLQDDAAIEFSDPELLPIPPQELSDEKRALIIKNRSKIESFLQAVESFELAQAHQGKLNRYLKVVEGRSQRKWLADEDAVAAGLKELGVKTPRKRVLRTITEVEREIGKGKVDALCEKTRPSLKVVAVEDKRQPIEIGKLASEEFEGIEDEEN